MKLVIYGAGAVGIQIKEIAECQNSWEEIIFIDDATDDKFFRGLKIFKFDDFIKKYNKDEVQIVIGVGDPKTREAIYNKIIENDYSLANVIHPNSYISKDAKLGSGVVVEMASYIGFDVEIKDNVLISAGACISHNCEIDSHSTVLGGIVAGNCKIGKSSLIGMGSVIREKTTIGDKVLVSMGSIVFNDIPSNMVVMGNPARIIGENTGAAVFK